MKNNNWNRTIFLETLLSIFPKSIQWRPACLKLCSMEEYLPFIHRYRQHCHPSIHPSATLLKLYVGIFCFVLLETSAYTRIEMILKHEHIEHVKCDFSLQSFRMSFFSRIIQQTIIDCTTENVTTIVIKHDTDTTNTCTMSVISSSRSGRHYVFDICWKWFVWNWFCDKIPSSSICIYLSSNNVKPLLGT